MDPAIEELMQHAHATGVTARKEGAPYTHCPYHDHSLRTAWQRGWREQHEQHNPIAVQRWRH